MPENVGKMQTRMTPNADSFYKVTYKIKPKRMINDLGLSYVHYSSCIFATAQKKFSIKDFFSKCDQMRRKLHHNCNTFAYVDELVIFD